ncbi:MAG TPA: hypothetical protein VGO84_05580 [Burkholderiales bacterium]|nr:hypothetical protein [Burkholderiales bacterium]
MSVWQVVAIVLVIQAVAVFVAIAFGRAAKAGDKMLSASPSAEETQPSTARDTTTAETDATTHATR